MQASLCLGRRRGAAYRGDIMQRTAPLLAIPPAEALPIRVLRHLRHAWRSWTLDADERHLAQACDHADLEQRLRRLERGRDDRFGPLQEWRP
jgi:hypothetical protein